MFTPETGVKSYQCAASQPGIVTLSAAPRVDAAPTWSRFSARFHLSAKCRSFCSVPPLGWVPLGWVTPYAALGQMQPLNQVTSLNKMPPPLLGAMPSADRCSHPPQTAVLRRSAILSYVCVAGIMRNPAFCKMPRHYAKCLKTQAFCKMPGVSGIL